MASAIVYDNVAEGTDIVAGELFKGYKFWVAQRVPQRAALLDTIRANGGSIVLLEKQADWLIADHFLKNCPPGTISYEFVQKSVAKGEILDPDDFPAGPRVGTARDVGSMVRPAKGTRAAYTPDEDRQLYKWVRDAQAKGVAVSGNELYKQLEQKNPRHTWQSWRDRYLKKLQFMPPSAFNTPADAPPSPPSDQSSRPAEAPVVKRTGIVKSKDSAHLDTAGETTSMGTASSKEQAAHQVQATTTEITTEPPVVRRTGLVKNKDKVRTSVAEGASASTRIVTSKEQSGSTSQAAIEDASSKEDYNVEQLAATFSARDWEELYAYVEEIDSLDKKDVSYEAAWRNWAEKEDNQTAEQWRQYYVKVVRPQWLIDPVSKRERIRKKVMERHKEDSLSPTKSQSWSQTQDSAASQIEPTTAEEDGVADLKAIFSQEDWEDLYAYAQRLDRHLNNPFGWDMWAQQKNKGTGEQWRKYFEKAVWPQWDSDQDSTKAEITQKVLARDTNPHMEAWETLYDRQWKDLRFSPSGNFYGKYKAERWPHPGYASASNILSSDTRLESEATAQPETPLYIRTGYETALKRIRGDTDAAPESTNASRPTKIRRKISMSPSLEAARGAGNVNGTQQQPVEISSAAGSQQGESERPLQEETVQSETQKQVTEVVDLGDEASSETSEDDHEPLVPLTRPPVSQADEEESEEDADDLESLASSTDLTHIAPLPRPPQIPEASDDEDSLPSSTPTPRAPKFAAFDTQAILSPSQNPHFISRLPRPPLDSSPPHHPDSEASTTQSLQEFSSYLKDEGELAMQREVVARAPRSISLTPSAASEAESIESEASSTDSGDPDAPLAADEMEDFIEQQHAEGFTDEYITKALKRTRFRPGLATAVLEAWRMGDPLPNQRGIWSVEDDEMVESGDGAALARLQRKHTLDGWGGITERMNFLSAWSRR